MTVSQARKIRCAIYTRVSTEQGLEKDFNSLDAQHDASAAYIRSQAHAGWTQIKTQYDDGGFSGGNTDRPALQRLLDDVKARKIDIVVVYKVDRLTRSLADFAKLVELFDQYGVSFVSVTQQFNTTTSMGRLTLNVLLSFAQFEREVTSERIRDKIAASKRKGLWVGGMVPLGYTVRDKTVVVVEEEAQHVRIIFETYLQQGSILRTLTELRRLGILTKRRLRADGSIIGGIPFSRGPLSYFLKNRFYIGEVVFKGEVLKGPQQPILDRSLFDAVQDKLQAHLNDHSRSKLRSEALLTGKIFDDRGNAMGPSHTLKNGVRYRYYISRPILNGETYKAGTVNRVPASEIEFVVVTAIQNELGRGKEPQQPKDLMAQHLTRVEVRPGELVILVQFADQSKPKTLTIPWQKPPSKKRRELLIPTTTHDKPIRPIRSESRTKLVTSIVQGRRWLNELLSDPLVTQDVIARRDGCSLRKVNMTISLALLAPGLVTAAIEGRLPRGLGVATLSDLPIEWSEQYKALGLASPY